jgi:mRNA-degrading endonuclease RelE of RelBE toxin-antitoxin system
MFEIRFAPRARKQIDQFDNQVRKAMHGYLQTLQKAETITDLSRFGGKALKGNLKGLWRFKNPAFEGYRIIGINETTLLVIVVLTIEKRDEAYKNKEKLARQVRKI